MKRWIGTALVITLAACDPAARELHVFAAASLREVVTDIADHFGAEHGVVPVCNFGSSGRLAVQIERGGNTDVFLSAGRVEVARLDSGGLLASPPSPLLSNRLVVIAPANHAELEGPQALLRFDKIALGDPDSVPAGRYAKRWLESIDAWDTLGPRSIPALDVRAVIATVEHGGADVGIVYRTDARVSDAVRVAFEVDGEHAPKIEYPVALLRDAREPDLAARFLRFLRSPVARQAFTARGFLIVEGR